MSLIKLGIISEIRGNQAKIAIGEMISDYLHVINIGSNSFSCGFKPLRVGEQVVVMPVEGDINSGIVLTGLARDKYAPPHTNPDEQIARFEDGVSISYNSSTSTLNISSPKAINLNCDSFNLNASKQVSITAPQIALNGNTQISGNISTSGSGGASGSFSIKGAVNINGSLSSSGDISTASIIRDSKGDLTNHKHNDTDGGVSNPR